MASVLTIGTFDGVHLGHQALVQRGRAIADATPAPRPRVVTLVFDPSPLEVLRPDAAPARLTTFAQRERWLREAGADEVVRLQPTPELLGLSPDEFVARTVAEHAPIAFVEGQDFRFGRGRTGDVRTLAQLGGRHGYTVSVVEPVTAVLGDHSVVTVSSTMVRWLIRHGRVRDAAALLGRPHTISGEVVRGDRRGRTIGFPTANIRTPCLRPSDGIYAGRALLPTGRIAAAAVHVGERPTFDGAAPTLEAFLMGEGVPGSHHSGGGAWEPLPGLPEYGWAIELEIIAWLRDQIRFESVEALVDQMRRDCDQAFSLVAPSIPSASAPETRR